jgi:uncharacterized RDD family membrane protein YckC
MPLETQKPAHEPVKPIPTVTDPDPRQVQSLIDSIMARQSAVKVEGMTQTSNRAVAGEAQDGGLILLSRTLSGLVDILIVGLITASFIIAADVFSGIDVFDAWSRIHFGILLLAVFFLYSIFFLGAANQTVGMMIKDLRLVAEGGGRPRLAQIFGRSACYLLAFLALGAGLIWGCFNRRSLCLHDQLSHTYVIRL